VPAHEQKIMNPVSDIEAGFCNFWGKIISLAFYKLEAFTGKGLKCVSIPRGRLRTFNIAAAEE
jgi:hypothetical protein